MTKKIVIWLLATLLLTAVCTAEAQQPKKVPRIGYLTSGSPSDPFSELTAFLQGLHELGYVEGQNIVIEYRYAEGQEGRLSNLADELVRLKVDVVVAGGNSATQAAKKTSSTIPIVMAYAGDPVATGLIDNLARPGGNITGLTNIAPELAGKLLELLKEVLPKLTRVGVLWNSESQTSNLGWKESQIPARELGLRLYSMEIRSPNDFERAFEEAKRAHSAAVAVTPNQLFVVNQKRIADLAAKGRLPSIFHLKEFAESGALMSYGPYRADAYRRAATYVDKILKGGKPADLPVEQPMKFELVINLKAAKQIGLTIPPNVLGRADRVIR